MDADSVSADLFVGFANHQVFSTFVVIDRILVWGAVTITIQLGVSDMIIGQTLIAVGNSLSELASSMIATRKTKMTSPWVMF